MRLNPAVTEQEAMSWLLSQAATDSSFKATEEELNDVLKPIAEAMAAVSAIVLPIELEPLFP